jgi:hypothetical protein
MPTRLLAVGLYVKVAGGSLGQMRPIAEREQDGQKFGMDLVVGQELAHQLVGNL